MLSELARFSMRFPLPWMFAGGAALALVLGACRGDDASRTSQLGEERSFIEHWVQRGEYRIRVREYAGDEPAIVLMHGFPDNMHLYDRLVPHLAGRRLVLFDFLGWGDSDKPEGYPYTFANLEGDLDAVVEGLGLDRVVLVGHDASGPPAINWALAHPEQVAALVLLNTFYSPSETINPPEAIRIFSNDAFDRLAQAIVDSPEISRWLFFWQVGQFFRDAEVRDEFVPLFYETFEATPSARPAFLRLNEDLGAAVLANAANNERLAAFPQPVRIIFGEDDPYLNADYARYLDELFGDSELLLVKNARHYVQIDEPAEVARLILETPLAGR